MGTEFRHRGILARPPALDSEGDWFEECSIVNNAVLVTVRVDILNFRGGGNNFTESQNSMFICPLFVFGGYLVSLANVS